MLFPLSLVEIRFGLSEALRDLERLPNQIFWTLNVWKKTEQCSSSWSSWCRTWSRLIAAQCTSTATTTIYLLFRTVMNALNVLSETDWFQSVSATSVLCTSVNVVLSLQSLVWGDLGTWGAITVASSKVSSRTREEQGWALRRLQPTWQVWTASLTSAHSPGRSKSRVTIFFEPRRNKTRSPP